jgi:DNA-binding NtrC family response regulator
MGATMTMADAGWGHWGPGTAAASAVSSDVKYAFSLEEETRSEGEFEGIVGQSAALREVLEQVETVAATDSTVLLLGETGTGKELIARALHDRSHRKARPLVKVNCAAIPSGLLESELFGHERGAFTGAITQKMGRLELADHGTLFLDEVGDIPLELQPKLLRVLQEREFERLGSTRTMKVDVRLVAATHRDLEGMMAENQFRSDLYYRLNVIPIRIPALRERREDIPLLVRYFADKFARRMGKQIDTIPTGALRKLMGWYWPGNIRELENTVERAVILTAGDTLEISVPQCRKSVACAAPGQHRNFDEQKRMVRVLESLVKRAAMLTPENTQPVSAPELTNNGASAAPATVPARVSQGFEECTQCGACYDVGVGHCAKEGAALTPISIPRLLAGRYRLERRLGRGGMGTVYEATDDALGRRVAVKLIREDPVGKPDAAHRFRREAQVAASFAHPNVVTVFDFGLAGSHAFLVMELLEGTTLREEIRSRGTLAPVRTVEIMRGVCAALEVAHQRHLIHRDLKPENVFLARAQTDEIPKVLDFGLAKFVHTAAAAVPNAPTASEAETGAGVLLGTLQYMAPEQLAGGTPQPAWDLWALAVLAYEMLTGTHPFGSVWPDWHRALLAGSFTPITAHLPESPSKWTEFFARALALDPKRRPDSARSFFLELERALA